MKTRITLQRPLYTFAFAALAVARLGAQAGGESSAAAQVAAAPALEVQALSVGVSSNPGPASTLGTPSLFKLPPMPTFDGDIVHEDDGLDIVTHAAQFRVALLDETEVTWSSAPSQITLVQGDHILLEIADERPHLVRWTGAAEIESGKVYSRAEFHALAAGVHLVEAEILSQRGQPLSVASLVIEVTGTAELGGFIKALGAAFMLAEGTCRMSVVQIVPGITDTFIAVVNVCNAGGKATKFKFDIAASAPEGKEWSADAPAATGLLGPGECATVYVTFALLDTDPASEPSRGHASLTLSAYGKYGILSLLGSAKAPAASVELLDVCFGCNED